MITTLFRLAQRIGANRWAFAFAGGSAAMALHKELRDRAAAEVAAEHQAELERLDGERETLLALYEQLHSEVDRLDAREDPPAAVALDQQATP